MFSVGVRPICRSESHPNITLNIPAHTNCTQQPPKRQLRIKVAADPSASLRDALAAVDQRWSVTLSQGGSSLLPVLVSCR